jgi:hypothetical protein
VRGGFLQRLKEGTWTGHILEHVVLELMTLAGLPDGFGRTRETTTRGVCWWSATSTTNAPAWRSNSAASCCWPPSR